LPPLPGLLKFVLLRWNVPGGGVQPPPVVDLVDEVRQPLDHIFHRFVFVSVHLLVLEGLEETLGVGVVVRIALAAHRPSHPQRLEAVPVLLGRVLAARVGVMDQSRSRPSVYQRGQGQPDVQESPYRVSHHPAGPGVEEDGQEDKGRLEPDVGDIRYPSWSGPVGVKFRARLGKTGRAWSESVVTRNRLTRFGVRASSRMILAIRLWLATIPRRRSSRVTRRYP
jgi:hypothetical protein